MAKNTCAICGAEVNIFTGQQLADKTYICRKVCAKKCLKAFDFIPAKLDEVKSHIEQVEKGTKAWNQIFVPLQKTKVKEEKLKRFGADIYVSPSTGLMALVETRYKFIIFGKSQFACVYRIADLASYEYEEETVKNSEGKEEKKEFCRMFFHNTAGLYSFRFEISNSHEFKSIEKYFDTLFGIQKTLGNSINNAKKQWAAIKDIAGAVKAAATGAEDVEEKAKDAAESLGTYLAGDRTELIAKADAALAKVQ
jgi:hypothetical protein